jgi:stalled ribosome rescue protein Dom34
MPKGPSYPSKKEGTTMSITFHLLVWIDHQEAKLYAVSRHDLTELATIHAPDQGRGHIHHKAGTMGPGHDPVFAGFLREVTGSLENAREILIVGPSDARHALKTYLAQNAPRLNERVIGVESMGKCGPGELQAFASRFFRNADRMRSSS